MAVCSHLTPFNTRLAQAMKTQRPIVRPSAVSTRAAESPEDLVQRTPQSPPIFSKDSTLFGVEIEVPATGDLSANYAQILFEISIMDKLKNCSFGLDSWSQNLGYYFQMRDQKRTPSSLKIYVKTDPNVVEISTSPLSYAQTESWKDILDSLIFATSAEIRNRTLVGSSDDQRNRWSGHLNVSWPGLMVALGKHDAQTLKMINYMGSTYRLTTAQISQLNMNLILNLYVDLQNHPQLSMGLLGGDVRNATPLAFGSEQEQNVLREIISKYKRRQFTDTYDLAKALTKAHPSSFGGRYNAPRFSLLNFENIIYPDFQWGYTRGSRIELRGFYSPNSVDEMLANFRIINGRLNFLYKLDANEPRVLEFNPPKIDREFIESATMQNFKVEGLTGNLRPEEVASMYIKYLSEAGLNPKEEYKFIRDPSIRSEVAKKLGVPNLPCVP